MKRKKKRMSTLVRVLLCSWCVLGLVLAFFVIKWALNLSEPEGPGDTDVLAKVTGEPGVTQTVTPPDADETPTPGPTATPVPQAEFTIEYAHAGDTAEGYGYTDGVSYGLRYPRRENGTEEAAVYEAAQKLLTEKITELSKERGEERTLLIDYEDAECVGLFSVLFYVEKEVDGNTEAETSLWIYNKKKEEPVEAPQDLFADLAYRYVAQQVNELLAEESLEEPAENAGASEQQESTFAGIREEFAEYLLTVDGVMFYFEAKGERRTITIPYIALHTYMAVTENGTVVADTIRELDPDKPMIALTFDDGPHFQQTPRLLELLEQYNARSTFFILGDRSHFTESNKETVKLVAEAGHEIASHTYSHKDLKTLTLEQLTDEIVKARENLYALTGEYPTMVRPPYGSYNNLVKEYSYAPLITWNLDSKDWSFRDAQMVVDHVLTEAGDGKIVLMHDIHWFTVDAIEQLLPELTARGYQIVTVRELFYYKNVELENGKVYHSSYN